MELDIANHFQQLLEGEDNLKSTGQAAIETLMRCIEISKGSYFFSIISFQLLLPFSFFFLKHILYRKLRIIEI